MLRLKSGITLREVAAKYGLRVVEHDGIVESITTGKLTISGASRSIRIIRQGSPYQGFDCLYYMIQDGLVEVVE